IPSASRDPYDLPSCLAWPAILLAPARESHRLFNPVQPVAWLSSAFCLPTSVFCITNQENPFFREDFHRLSFAAISFQARLSVLGRSRFFILLLILFFQPIFLRVSVVDVAFCLLLPVTCNLSSAFCLLTSSLQNSRNCFL